MKVEWEEADIKAGLLIGNPKHREEYVIGYVHFGSKQYSTLNSTADGMVRWYANKSILKAQLNINGDIPAFLLK